MILFNIAQKQEKLLTIEVSNNWKQAKTDAPVVINLQELEVGFKVKSAVVTEDNIEIKFDKKYKDLY